MDLTHIVYPSFLVFIITMSSDVRSTLGAALAGCIAAVGLSAVLGFQTFLYFQIFPSDAHRYKILVAWIWITDAVHTVLICTAVWQYIILNFSNPEIVENIFPAVAVTVSLTAVITLSVNVFYGWRIHKLSKHNWWLSGPIAFLSIVRVGLAFTTTTEMLLSRTFPAFAGRFKILFTSGLAISAVTDIIVSGARYYYIRTIRQGYTMSHEAVDAVVVFTINDGCLTCAVVIISIACWLSMPHNFVYLGIYFTIAKFYSNSVLATLNLRNWYRHRYVGPRPIGIPMKHPISINGVHSTTDPHPGNSNINRPPHKKVQSSDVNGMPGKMEVFIDHQVEYNVGDFPRENNYDVDAHSSSSRKSLNIA
ncbi:hypothetical protein C8R44DRAFT_772945 [Mycena epipterygia]|nr:hypothetical protein C8R44DRAFT_772945 [Mycena epipterygia]